MTDVTRRLFLKGAGAASVLGLGLSLGLVRPARALTGGWPAAAFRHKHPAGAVAALFGHASAQSGGVTLEVAELAENGAVVPVTVRSNLPGIESVALIVDHNPFSLVTLLQVGPGASGFLKTRIKMNKTSPVRAYVKTRQGLHVATHTVKVTVGGCGG